MQLSDGFQKQFVEEEHLLECYFTAFLHVNEAKYLQIRRIVQGDEASYYKNANHFQSKKLFLVLSYQKSLSTK